MRFVTLRGFRPVSAGRASFYRSSAVSMSEESARVADAQSRADSRLRRQRGTLRPLGLVLIAAVVVAAINGHPAPETHGTGLGVAVAIAVFALALGFAIRDSFPRRSAAVQAAVIAAMGAAGVALVALQPRGATELAGGAAIWMAVARLPFVLGLTVGAAVGVALCIAMALAGGSSAAVVATGLLCALLGITAYLIRQARASQDTTELLLAELEDAREEQLEAAAITSALGSRASSTTSWPTRFRAQRFSCRARGSWRSGSTRAPTCVQRSTVQASWSGTGLPVPVRQSARSEETTCPASTSSSRWSRATGPT